MCDRYYGRLHDYEALTWVKAWRVVKRGGLQGPIMPMGALMGLGDDGRPHLVAHEDPLERYGFHGFCVLSTLEEAVGYLDYLRLYPDHRHGLEVVEVQVNGRMKLAEAHLYSGAGKVTLVITLAERMREVRSDVP